MKEREDDNEDYYYLVTKFIMNSALYMITMIYHQIGNQRFITK